jgi:peptidyl-prolyl cis-trans isomerase SurA
MLLTAMPAAAARVAIAAIVNDEVITSTDVAERRNLIMASNNIPPTTENQQRITPKVMEALIDETIQLQEARRLSIAITDEEIESALSQYEAARKLPPGALKASFAEHGLSMRSLENQFRAQLAWNKVVQKKLRRNVSISADEILRAQQAQAAAPGVPQLRISAVSIMVPDPSKESAQAALAQEISTLMQSGKDMATIARAYATRPDVRVTPPNWVEEERLQPAMQQALRELQPGQVTPPLKSLTTYQILELHARRNAPKVLDSTEVAIKEIGIPLPEKPDEKNMLTLRDMAQQVQTHPGSCTDEQIGVAIPQAKVRYVRTTLGAMASELKSTIAELGVTQVSEPMLIDDVVKLFMLCERIDAMQGNLPPAKEVRQQLFAEKIELEAQKHLRDLKRDAFIDIKGAPSAADDDAKK